MTIRAAGASNRDRVYLDGTGLSVAFLSLQRNLLLCLALERVPFCFLDLVDERSILLINRSMLCP
jgi:hypothetical protein